MRILLTTLSFCILNLIVNGQDLTFKGTHPVNQEVLTLLQNYRDASTNWKTVEERDAKRTKLVSKGYFYHGFDGAPIDFEGLNARQTKNELTITENLFYDIILYQYENTALVTYKTKNKGMDKGKPFENFGSSVLVIGKEDGQWKVLSDIIGQTPQPNK